MSRLPTTAASTRLTDQEGPRSEAGRRPNIVLIVTDQHRASCLGCAGDPVIQTPHLDLLSASGVLFERAYCQGPLCVPARVSLATERYVRDTGAYENRWGLPDGMPTFLQSVQSAGYYTVGVGKIHLKPDRTPGRLDPSTATGFGFDETVETVGKFATAKVASEYTDYLAERGLLETYYDYIRRHNPAEVPVWAQEPTPLPADAYQDSWVGRRAERWIESWAGHRPFFLWVGFPGPHDPFDAPEEYLARYADSDPPLATTVPPERPLDRGPLDLFLQAVMRHCSSEKVSPEATVKAQRAYYANCTVIDEAVGSVVGVLDDTGLLRDTWIIYTSDHGEMLGTHRLFSKMVFYEPAVRVPLIVRPPGGLQSRRVSALVEHLDLASTIRAITGAPDVPGSEGRSLLAHFDETARPVLGREVVHSENFGFAMFASDRYKLVVYEDELLPVQLFDLVSDPHEDHNAVNDPVYAEVVEELMDDHVRPFFCTPPRRPGLGLIDRMRRRAAGAVF